MSHYSKEFQNLEYLINVFHDQLPANLIEAWEAYIDTLPLNHNEE